MFGKKKKKNGELNNVTRNPEVSYVMPPPDNRYKTPSMPPPPQMGPSSGNNNFVMPPPKAMPPLTQQPSFQPSFGNLDAQNYLMPPPKSSNQQPSFQPPTLNFSRSNNASGSLVYPNGNSSNGGPSTITNESSFSTSNNTYEEKKKKKIRNNVSNREEGSNYPFVSPMGNTRLVDNKSVEQQPRFPRFSNASAEVKVPQPPPQPPARRDYQSPQKNVDLQYPYQRPPPVPFTPFNGTRLPSTGQPEALNFLPSLNLEPDLNKPKRRRKKKKLNKFAQENDAETVITNKFLNRQPSSEEASNVRPLPPVPAWKSSAIHEGTSMLMKPPPGLDLPRGRANVVSESLSSTFVGEATRPVVAEFDGAALKKKEVKKKPPALPPRNNGGADRLRSVKMQAKLINQFGVAAESKAFPKPELPARPERKKKVRRNPIRKPSQFGDYSAEKAVAYSRFYN